MALSTFQIARDDVRPSDAHVTPMQQLSFDLGAIFQRAALLDDLAAIEQLLIRRADSRAPLLAAAGVHTIGAGGKRLRAALVLLAARLGHYDFERVSHPAAAIELLHAASLVHDDLVDHTMRCRAARRLLFRFVGQRTGRRT